MDYPEHENTKKMHSKCFLQKELSALIKFTDYPGS